MTPVIATNPSNPFDNDGDGKTKGKIDVLLTILRAKFNQIPRRIENAIRQKTDPIVLDSLALSAATCQSLAEFEKDLD